MLQVHVAQGSGSSSLLRGTIKDPPIAEDFLLQSMEYSSFQEEVRPAGKADASMPVRLCKSRMNSVATELSAVRLLHKTTVL